MTSRGQCPRGGGLVNVQEWGCFSNFLRADDVTRTMSKGGGVLVKNPVSAPGPPPPSKNPGSAPVVGPIIFIFYFHEKIRNMSPIRDLMRNRGGGTYIPMIRF